MALDTDALAASLYDHPKSGHNAAPQATAKPSATGTDNLAELLYDHGDSEAKKLSRRPFNEIFGQPAEQPKDEGAKADEHEGVRDRPREAVAKSPEEVAVAAEKVTTELQLDPANETTNKFASAAVELGLDAKGADRLVQLELEHRSTEWARIQGGWRAEISADPQSNANIAGARAVLKRFGTPALGRDLDHYRFGDHPGFIKLLGNVARALNLK
jgi:hypothetical protein